MSSMSISGTVEQIVSSANLIQGSRHPGILIVDSDEEYRQLYGEILRSEGYQTFCAEDGEQALGVLHHERIDMAMIDMSPRTNGVPVYRKLKSNPEVRRVLILLLVSSGLDSLFTGIKVDSDGCLTKSLNKLELLTRVRGLFENNLDRAEKVLLTLAQMVEAKNPYIAGHGHRVADTAVYLAARIGLSHEEKDWVRRGALLHDIGNAGIPDEILNKTSPLNSEEKTILNSHTYLGERICAPLISCPALPQIIRNHHERLDGSGYPDGLRGNQISIWTQVVSLADVYDSLTARRPYRGSFSHTQAIHQMRREAMQGWWDINIVEKLANIVN